MSDDDDDDDEAPAFPTSGESGKTLEAAPSELGSSAAIIGGSCTRRMPDAGTVSEESRFVACSLPSCDEVPAFSRRVCLHFSRETYTQ